MTDFIFLLINESFLDDAEDNVVMSSLYTVGQTICLNYGTVLVGITIIVVSMVDILKSNLPSLRQIVQPIYKENTADIFY